MRLLSLAMLFCLISDTSFAQSKIINEFGKDVVKLTDLSDTSGYAQVFGLVSTDESECHLDSIIEEHDGNPNHRFYYHYDSNGNIVEFITQSWNGLTSQNGYRYSHSYNSDGLETQELRQVWSMSESQWQNDLRYTSVYNPLGKRIEYKMEFWNGNEYVNSELQIHNYSLDSQPLESVYQYWANGEWVGHVRYLFEYDQLGNLIIETRLDWDGNGYVNDKKTTSEYNSDNNLVSKIEQYWSSLNWVNYSRQTFQYTGEIVAVALTEDYNGMDWEPEYRVLYTYDQSFLLIEELHQWSDGLIFEDRYKNTYTYNSEGLMASWLREQSIPGVTNGWEYVDINTYAYDPFGNRTRLSFRAWNNGSWEPWQDYYYYFNCASTTIMEENPLTVASVYPNPAIDHVNINLVNVQQIRTINLIDISGKVIQKIPVTGTSVKIDLTCSSGVYLIEFIDSSRRHYQTLLVK